jgi:transcriptional repressor NrdR
MFCINCFHSKTNVINSRPHKKHPDIWRRRQCPNCGTTFSTKESVDLNLSVIKPSSPPVAYSKAILTISILQTITSAGLPPNDAYWLSESVEERIIDSRANFKDKSKLASSLIKQLAYQVLSAYHPAAGLAYGTVQGLVVATNKRGRPKSFKRP